MARRVLQLDLEEVRMLPILVVLDRLVAAKEEAASLMAGEKDIGEQGGPGLSECRSLFLTYHAGATWGLSRDCSLCVTRSDGGVRGVAGVTSAHRSLPPLELDEELELIRGQ